jgi:hypothetical protein
MPGRSPNTWATDLLRLAFGLDHGVCWTAALLFGGAKDRCLSPISAQTEPAPLDGAWIPFAVESALGRFEQVVNVHPGVRQHVIAIVTVDCRCLLRI